jgi:3-deoxy-D-manno-octulosonate 8-phosphate phosphatase (KDO 8-P phosphatase)
VLDQICAEHNLSTEAIAYAGDDAPDVPVLERVGLAASVPAGHRCALEAAHMITGAQGGSGAVREIIDFILASQGKLTY